MRLGLILFAGALCLVVTAGQASAMAWGDTHHRRGNGPNGWNESSGSASSGSAISVPEPSSLYAIGSALALLGGAGFILRRK